MAPRASSLTSVKGRVIFINIRNIYASSEKEIRLALVDSTGARRDYELRASFTDKFLDIRRDDIVELVWNDQAAQSLRSITNLRTNVTYVAAAGCLVPIAATIGLLLLLLAALWVGIPR